MVPLPERSSQPTLSLLSLVRSLQRLVSYPSFAAYNDNTHSQAFWKLVEETPKKIAAAIGTEEAMVVAAAMLVFPNP